MPPGRTTFRPESQQPDRLIFKPKMITFIHEKNEVVWFEGKWYKKFVLW